MNTKSAWCRCPGLRFVPVWFLQLSTLHLIYSLWDVWQTLEPAIPAQTDILDGSTKLYQYQVSHKTPITSPLCSSTWKTNTLQGQKDEPWYLQYTAKQHHLLGKRNLRPFRIKKVIRYLDSKSWCKIKRARHSLALLLPSLLIWSTPFDCAICLGFENIVILDKFYNLLRKACHWIKKIW